ncbi:MAG: hypothetical protein PHP70_10605 [Gallionella sp.]|nr:hypothetical protein [Gallionella sp.]
MLTIQPLQEMQHQANKRQTLKRLSAAVQHLVVQQHLPILWSRVIRLQ